MALIDKPKDGKLQPLAAKKPRPWYLKKRFILAALLAAALIAQALGVPVAAPIKAVLPLIGVAIPDDDTPAADAADDDAKPGELPVLMVTPAPDDTSTPTPTPVPAPATGPNGETVVYPTPAQRGN